MSLTRLHTASPIATLNELNIVSSRFPDVIHIRRYECMRFAKSVREIAIQRNALFAYPLAAITPVTIKLSCHPDVSLGVAPETLRRCRDV